MLAATGNTTALRKVCLLLGDPHVLLKMPDERGRTPLYLAARSGFVDLTTYLLSSQHCSVNAVQGGGSTALHGASFFGHRPVAELLLESGANPAIINDMGEHTAADEAKCSGNDLSDLFSTTTSKLAALRQSCVDEKLVGAFTEFKHTGKTKTTVGFVAHRPLCDETRTKIEDYPLVFHGTKAKHVTSILKNGLHPSGSVLPDGSKVVPPSGHFTLGTKHGGVDNWAGALFLTPSVTYAAHNAYAEAIADSNSARYRVIVIARVKPGSFRKFSSTVTLHTPMPGEVDDDAEFRVSNPFSKFPADEPSSVEHTMPGESEDGEILRIDERSNVVVTGILLLRQSFVNSLPDGLTLDDFKELVDNATDGAGVQL